MAIPNPEMDRPNVGEITEEQLMAARINLEEVCLGLSQVQGRDMLAARLPEVTEALGVILMASGGLVVREVQPVAAEQERGIASAFFMAHHRGAQIVTAELHDVGVQLGLYGTGIDCDDSPPGRKVIIPSAEYIEANSLTRFGRDKKIVAADTDGRGATSEVYPFIHLHGVPRDIRRYVQATQMLCNACLSITKGREDNL